MRKINKEKLNSIVMKLGKQTQTRESHLLRQGVTKDEIVFMLENGIIFKSGKTVENGAYPSENKYSLC